MMGDESIIIEQFFYGFEGVIIGSIMGSQNIMGSDDGSNISVLTEHFNLELFGILSNFHAVLSDTRTARLQRDLPYHT
jgi:hypothetical protein